MNVLTYPLRYLSLCDEHGRRLYLRNLVTVILLTIAFTLPFWLTDANYYADGGLLDRFGNFSAVLSGFYIAALVAVASFGPSLGDIDDVIQVGKITRAPDEEGDEPETLTRRQYVCSLFGYLAFLSLLISVLGIVVVTVAGAGSKMLGLLDVRAVRPVGLLLAIVINLIIAHMIVTTCHGLYYLIDRLYAKSAKLLPKSETPERAKRDRS